MSEGLAQSQIREFNSVFKYFSDGAGDKISEDSLKKALPNLGLFWDDKKVKDMMVEVNGSGKPFGFGEFNSVLGIKLKNTSKPSLLLAAFKSFDPEGKGYIPSKELKASLQELAGLTDSEWNGMCTEIGGQAELFDYQKLVDKMTSTDSTKKKEKTEDINDD